MAVTVIGTLAASAIFVVIFAYYFAKRLRVCYLMSKFDGPLAFPLIGTSHLFRNDPREAFLLGVKLANEYRQKTGGCFTIWFGPLPSLIVYSAKYMEVILSSSQHLSKGYIYTLVEPWLGQGLLTSTGEKWFHRRKMLTPTFHFSILKTFMDVFNEQSATLVNKMARFADKPEPVNIFPHITRCVLDVICDTAMGRHINAQADGENEYVKAVFRLTEIITLRSKKLLWWSDFIFSRTTTGKEHAQCLKILHGVTNTMIQERLRESPKSLSKVGGDDADLIGVKRKRIAFLDLLLQMHRDDKSFTLEDVREEVDTFMFEGHDTTASAISWAILLIARHPDVQRRLHEEIDEIFGNSERPVTSEDLANMLYLNCVVKEALRFLPPVPTIVRSLSDDVVLGEKVVPKETMIILDINHLHHDPEHFPDPEVFDPDRFLPENVAKRHPFAYVPFSAGPRNCIGQKFALLEDKVVLVNILRKFSLESTQTVDEAKPAGELVMRPVDGEILVKFSSRSKSSVNKAE